MSLASFIHKSRGAEEIVEAVRLVAGGGSFFTPEIVTGGETFALGVNLATPSSEVTSRQMAARLGISYTTIRTHLRSIDAKLGAHSQLEALRKARELGLIDWRFRSLRPGVLTNPPFQCLVGHDPINSEVQKC